MRSDCIRDVDEMDLLYHVSSKLNFLLVIKLVFAKEGKGVSNSSHFSFTFITAVMQIIVLSNYVKTLINQHVLKSLLSKVFPL